MEIGGLMAEAFKVFLGNPDIAVYLFTFALSVGLIFTAAVISSHFQSE